MTDSLFHVRTAFLVIAILGGLQALGSWIALRASVGRTLTASQRLWIGGNVAVTGMGLVIGLRPQPAPLGHLLLSHALMLLWLGMCWGALRLERDQPPHWWRLGSLTVLSIAAYATILWTWGEARGTAYPAVLALAGSLCVAWQARALRLYGPSGGARLTMIAFSLTGVVLLVRSVDLLTSTSLNTSVTAGATQVFMAIGGISVFVLGNLGFLGLQIERLATRRLEAEVQQARAEERSVQAQERVQVLQGLIAERDLLIQRLQRLDAVQQQALLAASLPHELRQPLGALRLNLDTLVQRMDRDGAVPAELVNALDQDTERLSVLIEDFMSLITAPVAGTPANEFSRVDLAAVARNALEVVQPRARLSHVSLSLSTTGATTASTCAATVQQILLIFLTNALDAVCDLPGPREVRVEAVGTPDDVQVRVTDNGPGIAPHVWPHLFQPFAGGKPQGSGIGLALAHRLAQRCRASLSAHRPEGSAQGSGATLVLHLAHTDRSLAAGASDRQAA